MNKPPNSLMPNEPRLQIGEFEHTVFYGTTNTGKTFKMKSLLVDKIINFDFEEFIYVGRPEQLEEIAKCYAAHLVNQGKDWRKGQMKYFGYTDLRVAISYFNQKHSKLIFFDDIFIQNPKFKIMIAGFINQAKNANNTVFLTVHEAYGEQPEKAVRKACNWFVMCSLNSQEIAKLTGKLLNDESAFMYEYIVRDKDKKCLFYNQLTQQIYDYNYIPIEAYSKTVDSEDE